MPSHDQARHLFGNELHHKSTHPQSLLIAPDLTPNAPVERRAAFGASDSNRLLARGWHALPLLLEGFVAVPFRGFEETHTYRVDGFDGFFDALVNQKNGCLFSQFKNHALS